MPIVVTLPPSYNTDRQDLNDALEAIVEAFITSTSYAIVRKYWSELPASLTGEGPFVAQGDITETVTTTDQGTIIVRYSGALWYIDVLTDPSEYNTRVNTFADHMRDLFAYNITVLPQGILTQLGLTEGELPQGTVRMGAPQLTFEFIVQRGRPTP